jgi:hypothetical protein
MPVVPVNSVGYAHVTTPDVTPAMVEAGRSVFPVLCDVNDAMIAAIYVAMRAVEEREAMAQIDYQLGEQVVAWMDANVSVPHQSMVQREAAMRALATTIASLLPPRP